MAKTVFISYSTKDAEGAEEICRQLEARGISCWIAPRDVPPGADWAESIMEGIKQAQGFVLVLSEHVNTSRHCKSEVEVAFSAGKAVFPVRLRKIEPSQSLHLFLSSSQWIDAFEPPLEAHMDRLADAVKRLAGEAAGAPAPAATAPAATGAARSTPKPAPAVAAKRGSTPNLRYIIGAAVAVVLLFGLWTMFGGRDTGDPEDSPDVGTASATPAVSGGEPSAGPVAASPAARSGEPEAGDQQSFDGIDFVWIPAGSFQMGSPTSERYRGRDERQHEVILSRGFWMSKFELTKDQWSAIMDTKPWQGRDNVPYADGAPATFIAWTDANLFISRLNNAEAGPYRLPTEAEWEYACRAGTTTEFSFGEHEGFRLDEYAWFSDNTVAQRERYPHPIGQKKPNPWGLYDMHGNVWEWCSDWYGDYPYPEDGAVTDPAGPESGRGRVARGGGFDSRSQHVRSAMRWQLPISRASANIGVRLVRDATQ